MLSLHPLWKRRWRKSSTKTLQGTFLQYTTSVLVDNGSMLPASSETVTTRKSKTLVRRNNFDCVRRWTPLCCLLRLIARPPFLLHLLVVGLAINFQPLYLLELLCCSMRFKKPYYRGPLSRLVDDHRFSGILITDEAKRPCSSIVRNSSHSINPQNGCLPDKSERVQSSADGVAACDVFKSREKGITATRKTREK